MLTDPCTLFAHIGLDDGRRDTVMIEGSEFIADVVQKGGHDPVDVGTIPLGPGRRLQRMAEAADLIASK